MLFNSLEYLFFLPAVVVLSVVVPERHRWALLLVASYGFYMSWNPIYLVLILASTATDYLAGRCIARSRTADRPGRARVWLIASVAVNLGLLFTYKYLDFFTDTLNRTLRAFGVEGSVPALGLVLPVGISFYTFQTLSYTIDVYRGRIPHESHVGRFALYVAFFPQLVAGPIERASHLLPQLRARLRPTPESFDSGIRLILWGLFKKVVVADRLSPLVDAVYGNVHLYQGLPLWWATYFFAFQIYCDFSGYSDIAIGSARLLGYDLMRNFDAPYLAGNLREFWSRWHISLSTWFRDYLYIPLGGSRAGALRHAVNLFLVFLVSGLWHGANWTFVVWGAYHGVLVLATRARRAELQKPRALWIRFLSVAVCFHVVLLGWVFFRAESISDALYVLQHMPRVDAAVLLGVPTVTRGDFLLGLAAIAVVVASDLMLSRFRLLKAQLSRPAGVVLNIGMLLAIYVFGVFERQEFIYFQF